MCVFIPNFFGNFIKHLSYIYMCGVIGALAERTSLPSSVATVEALACRRAVLFTLELSVFDATFEGDAELVSKALCAGGSNHPQFGLVINDSLSLASGFCYCNFTHVK